MAENRAERRLTTVLAADVAGYSHMMAADEAGTLNSLKAIRKEFFDPKTAEHRGRIVKLMGDGILMEFASVVDAVTFAVDVQRALTQRNADVPAGQRFAFRIGINIGDIIVDGEDIYGDGVNVAARLEALADPGGVCLSRSVHTQVKDKVDLAFEDLGERQVKNIPDPVHVFRILFDKPGAERNPSTLVPLKWAFGWKWIAAGLTLVVIVAGLVVWQRPWKAREEPASEANMAYPLPNKPSIAVLPFNNMSDDPNQEYFVDGMTEDLITDLSKISGLFVIARNSSFSYKGQQVKARQVAEELGVRYVLEGSVRRAGDQVRINAQLIDATSGGHVWAERYDGMLEDVFDLQDHVTERIVSALSVSLTGEEETQVARHGTENAEAHDAYLQGWARYKLLTPKDLAEAVPFFEDAIRLDPDYAQAHAALASLYWDVLQNDWAFDLGMPSMRAEDLANAHLEEALKDPAPLAHALQARMLASWGFHDDAVLEAEKAAALDENDAVARAGLADALVKADRPAEALAHIEQAMRLDPHHPPSYLIILGAAQFGLKRYEDAAATFERAIKRNSDNETPFVYLASAYGHLGQLGRADAVIESANDLRNSVGLGELSLRDNSEFSSPTFDSEINFLGLGSKSVQEQVRGGLIDIPALQWQYLIKVHPALGYGNTRCEVDGANEITVETAKKLQDQGAIFVDVSHPEEWKEQHIPDTIHLTYVRGDAPANKRFSRQALEAVAEKNSELVLYRRDAACYSAAWEAAKAVVWGYKKVFFFVFGAQAWKEAGFPIETGQ